MLFRGSQKRKYFPKNKISSLPGKNIIRRDSAPKSSGPDLRGRVAFCISDTLKKASLTVEAALVLPLFFLTVISLIGLMGIYGSFAREMVALQQKAEELAAAQVYTFKESTLPVRLYKTVRADLTFFPFAADVLNAKTAASVLPWTGRSDYSSLDSSDSSDGQLYYLTDNQGVYHTSSCCSCLSLTISSVESDRIRHMKNESGDHYTPCDKCIGAGETGSVVYVTENGAHYHNSPECSGLKQSTHLVDEEKIEGLSLCGRCRQEASSS